MPSAVETAANQYRELLLKRDAELARRLTREYQAVIVRLQTAIASAANQIAEAASRGDTVLTAQRLYQMERYQALLAQARAEVNGYANTAAAQIIAEQGAALETGIEAGNALVRSAYLDAGRVSGGFNILSAQAVGFQTGYTLPGTPLYKLIQAAVPESIDALTGAIVSGVALGSPVGEIARQIAKLAENALTMPLDRGLLIARTEVLRAYRTANQAQMSEAGVTQYRRMAALQPRTCIACIALDGKIYPNDGPFKNHVCCRCALIPLISGMPPSKLQSGRDWFNQQSEATKIGMVGQGRYEWLKQGGDFDKLAYIHHDRTWGDQVRQTPLKKLQEI